MQKRHKLHFLLCGFLSFVFLLGFSSAALGNEPLTSQNPSIQSEQKVVLQKTTYDQLKANNEKALTLIRESKVPLTEVSTLTANQAKELTALRSINEQQFNELTKAKSDLMTQKDYLNATNEYLTQLKADLKRNRATERRLERQRNTWAVVAGGILVAGILK